MEETRVGFALTGSFCTLDNALRAMEETAASYPNILPILSETTAATDTRFGRAEAFRQRAEEACGRRAMTSIPEVEPIGPKGLLDVLVIAPCTGNTLAKLAAGIADTAVTMAAKAHLRNGRPVVLAVSTNDGLGASGENIARLYQRKHYYFVPYGQDDPQAKPQSLKARFALLPAALDAALEGRQLQPVLCPAAGHGMSFQQGKSVVY